MKSRILFVIILLSFFNLNYLISENISENVTLQQKDVILTIHHLSIDKQSVHPIWMSLTNQSKNPIVISPKSVNVPLINAEGLFKHTVWDMLKLGTTGFLLSTGIWLLESLWLSQIEVSTVRQIIDGDYNKNQFRNPFTNITRYPFTWSVGVLSLATVIATPFEKKRLANLLLKDQKIINPGDIVTTVLLIDSKAWDGKLDFKVYDTQGSPVATFNVSIVKNLK